MASEDQGSRRWIVIALALSLGPAISNGFARFCYALVLPAMQSSLGWSYTEAGALNTANAVGYLLGAIAAPACLARFGASRLFRATMIVTVATLFAMAIATQYGLFLALRFAGGVSSAFTFVSGGVLVATLTADPRRSGAALAIYFSGIGFAMFATGLVLPWWFATRGDASWALAWFVMALAATGSVIAASWAAIRVAPSSGSARGARGVIPWRRFAPALGCYFAYGLGFIGYMTFIIAWLRTKSATPAETSLVWSLLSVMAILGPLWWRGPLARWSGATVLAVATMLTGAGAALALAGDSMLVLAASATLFGATFLITPAAVTAFGKASLPPAAWGGLVAGFTVAFAIGQIAGPLMTGWLADRFGGLAIGLAVSAAILVVGGAFGFLQPRVLARESD